MPDNLHDQSLVPTGTARDTDDNDATQLEQALLQLPAMTRAIFIAQRFQNQSIGQIMQVTGLSRRAVLRHLHRALAAIQTAQGGP